MATKWNESDTTAMIALAAGFLLMLGGYLAWSYGGLLFAAGLWMQSAVICRTIGTIRRKL